MSTASTPKMCWNSPTTGIEPPVPINTAGFGKISVSASFALESHGDEVGTEIAGEQPNFLNSQEHPAGVLDSRKLINDS